MIACMAPCRSRRGLESQGVLLVTTLEKDPSEGATLEAAVYQVMWKYLTSSKATLMGDN